MIYVFLANGFEEIEALATVDVLRRAELDVKTVGVGSKIVTGAHGIPVTADMEEADVRSDNMEMIVLPGGMPGTLNLEKSPTVRGFITHCAERQKYIAAICAAPSILGHMGLLKGHTAVCFPSYEGELTGAVLSSAPVCVSGKIITGKGAGVALEFGLCIVQELCGAQKAEAIFHSMQCTR